MSDAATMNARGFWKGPPLWQRWRRNLNAIPPLELVTIVALLLIFLFSIAQWYVHVPVQILCLSAIIFPPLRRQPVFWLVITAVLAVGVAYNWYMLDNHQFLVLYVSMLVFLAVAQGDRLNLPALQTSARLMLALCFIFAVIAKLLSPDYLDARFFLYEMQFDTRFRMLGAAMGDVEASTIDQHALTLARVVHGEGEPIQPVAVLQTPRMVLGAQFLTWWTLLLEAAIALLFLIPVKRKPFVLLRHASLWLFLVTTYAVASIHGFAWAIIVLALAQLPQEAFWLRNLYLLTAVVLLHLYLIPLAGMIQ